MTIHGITGPAGLPPSVLDRSDARTETALQPSAPQPAPVRAQPATDVAEARGAEAPAGVDPALWSVLTAEERVFFARARSIGPLTYAPGGRGAAEAAPPRGGRVDVRV